MEKILKSIKNRLKEPSTWSALAALAVLVGVKPETASSVLHGVTVLANAATALGVSPEQAIVTVQAVPAAIAGAVAIWLPERSEK